MNGTMNDNEIGPGPWLEENTKWQLIAGSVSESGHCDIDSHGLMHVCIGRYISVERLFGSAAVVCNC